MISGLIFIHSESQVQGWVGVGGGVERVGGWLGLWVAVSGVDTRSWPDLAPPFPGLRIHLHTFEGSCLSLCDSTSSHLRMK